MNGTRNLVILIYFLQGSARSMECFTNNQLAFERKLLGTLSAANANVFGSALIITAHSACKFCSILLFEPAYQQRTNITPNFNENFTFCPATSAHSILLHF